MVDISKPLACMGGFCHKRDQCALHYNRTEAIEDIRERICIPGKETPIPIILVKQVQHENHQAAA